MASEAEKSLQGFLAYCERMCATFAATNKQAVMPSSAPAAAGAVLSGPPLVGPVSAVSSTAPVVPAPASVAGHEQNRETSMVSDLASAAGDTYYDADLTGAVLQVRVCECACV
jgi:hypothetical protein